MPHAGFERRTVERRANPLRRTVVPSERLLRGPDAVVRCSVSLPSRTRLTFTCQAPAGRHMPLSDLQRELVDDLAVAIARERGGQDAGAMARAILAHESSVRMLVGLTEGAGEAAYYGPLMWGVQRLAFDADGVHERAGSQVTKCGDRDDLERWVREQGAALAWLHPRFRWVRQAPCPRAPRPPRRGD